MSLYRPDEEELLRELDAHDELVERCARGDLSFAEFEKAYDSFYPRYPLDGHESDARERELFEKHAVRIVLHREIWEQVLTKLTNEPLSPPYVVAGFIDEGEAVRRIGALAHHHLRPGLSDES